MLLHTTHPTHPKPGIAPLTQGKLKTLLQPHSLQRGCSSQPTQIQSAEERMTESLLLVLPPIMEAQTTWTAGRPAKGPTHPFTRKGRVEQGESSRPYRLQQQVGVLGRGSAGLMRSHDFEIPVQTSRSSPGPGLAPADGCAPPRGECSPRILAHSAHSAAAPAAAGLPWGSHHTPAANAEIRQREVVREKTWRIQREHGRGKCLSL